jgi:hypothetical protein
MVSQASERPKRRPTPPAPSRRPGCVTDVTLNKEINTAVADPTIKARLADLGCTPLVGSPAEFGRFMADGAEKWAKVIKFADIKPQ